MNEDAVKNKRLTNLFYAALGDINSYLNDANVTDIMLNPNGQLWLDTFTKGKTLADITLSANEGERIIRIISGIKQQEVTAENPSIQTEMPINGERFQGIIPPESEAPIFSIRKKPLKIFTLEEYVSAGSISKEQYNTIVNSIRNRKNIIVAGPTHSGKTTLGNAILHEIAKHQPRVAILEDTKELQCSVKNSFALKTCATRPLQTLIKETLRMNIDRIIVGEVRGGAEALALLKAWNTGHPGGLATIHADSATDTLYRLEELMQEVVAAAQTNLISRAVDLIIFIARGKEGKRQVQQIMQVHGAKNITPAYETSFI